MTQSLYTCRCLGSLLRIFHILVLVLFVVVVVVVAGGGGGGGVGLGVRRVSQLHLFRFRLVHLLLLLVASVESVDPLRKCIFLWKALVVLSTLSVSLSLSTTRLIFPLHRQNCGD